jgi:hypothetical protein
MGRASANAIDDTYHQPCGNNTLIACCHWPWYMDKGNDHWNTFKVAYLYDDRFKFNGCCQPYYFYN